MSVWRRKAIELLPGWHKQLEAKEIGIYFVFGVLLDELRRAFEENDEEAQHRIFAFAEWCSNQRTGELWNAAGVSFYEHLFDVWEDRQQVVPCSSPSVIANHWSLWEWRLSPERLAELGKLLKQRKELKYRLLYPNR